MLSTFYILPQQRLVERIAGAGMSELLTKDDFDVILESLRYSKSRIEDYEKYPSPEFKEGRLARIGEVISKVKALRPAEIRN